MACLEHSDGFGLQRYLLSAGFSKTCYGIVVGCLVIGVYASFAIRGFCI
jgi:hypothetical protein